MNNFLALLNLQETQIRTTERTNLGGSVYFVFECRDSWPTGKVLKSSHSYRVEIISLLTHLLSEPQLMFSSMDYCEGEKIINRSLKRKRKMKDPHWHNSKCNGEEGQPRCVFTQSPTFMTSPPGLKSPQRFLYYLWKERRWHFNGMRVFLSEGKPIDLY